MKIEQIFSCDPNEKPLDIIKDDLGFVSTFRKIAIIGDSLASGELESQDVDAPKAYHDCIDISWGQYMARMAGITVYNFTRGGMTASEYNNGWADANGCWDLDKLANAYIIALGWNDLCNCRQPIGSLDDINKDWHQNKQTYCGNYAKIIQHYRMLRPDAPFFLVTFANDTHHRVSPEERAYFEPQRELLYQLADYFENTYVIDLFKYGPEYDEEFLRNFFTGGHMNTMGYYITAKMIGSYIDYIVRHNMDKFNESGFIGTPYRFFGVR